MAYELAQRLCPLDGLLANAKGSAMENSNAIEALRRQLRVIWGALGVMALALVISVATVSVLLMRGKSVAVTGTVTSLHIGPSSNGDSMVLNGDGLSIVTKDNRTIATLHDTADDGPTLTFEHWATRSDWLDATLENRPEKKLAPEEVADITVSAAAVAINAGNTTAALRGGNLDLSLSMSRKGDNVVVSPSNVALWNDCTFVNGTCYQSRESLGPVIGMTVETCELSNGLPLDDKHRGKGCAQIMANTQGLDHGGASITLEENDNYRLIMGNASLTSKNVGGSVITPMSQITGFDNRGDVIWRIPPN